MGEKASYAGEEPGKWSHMPAEVSNGVLAGDTYLFMGLEPGKDRLSPETRMKWRRLGEKASYAGEVPGKWSHMPAEVSYDVLAGETCFF